MALSLKNYEVHVGPFKLGPLNFQSDPVGCYFIRGRNGSGKSSLLRSLIGRVRSRGHRSGLEFPVGTVGLEPILIGSWNLIENWNFLRNLARRSQAKFPEPLRELKEHRFDHLSQGWQRQIELRFILALELPTLFLDEPLSPLDRESRPHFADLIAEAAQKRLILMTSHFEEDLRIQPKGILELT